MKAKHGSSSQSNPYRSVKIYKNMRQKFIISPDVTFVSHIICFEIPVVKCFNSIQVKWSQSRDTGVTDPALENTKITKL